MIKNIIFDLGKVLFDYDWTLISQKFIKYAIKKEELKDLEKFIINNYKLFYAYEKGQIESVEFFNRLSKIVDLQMTYTDFCDAWNNMFFPMYETINLLPILHKKYKLSLLSNTNDLHYNFLKNLHPEVFENFDDFFLSYKMGVRKPEKEIYNEVIKSCKLNANEIFFVDDNVPNIEVAKKFGINAFVFESTDKLKKDLLSVGVSV